MSCRSGDNSCRLPGRFSSDNWSGWVVKKIWVTSGFGLHVMLVGSPGVSGPCTLQLYFVTRSKLYWDHSAWHGCFSRFITLLTPCATFLFGFHDNSPFHSHAWLLRSNTWEVKIYSCRYHRADTWRPWQCAATAPKENYCPRVGHDQPQSQLMQLPMTTRLYPGKSGDLLSSCVMTTLQFI